MPSNRFRLQVYLDADLEEHLRSWIAERQFASDSAALNQLLREYFNLEKRDETIEAIDWKGAIAAEVERQLEPIKSWLSNLDDNYGTILKFISELPSDLSGKSPTEPPNKQVEETEDQGKTIESLGDLPSDLSIFYEQVDEEIEQLLSESPSISTEYCAARAISILEAQFGTTVSRATLETYAAEDLLDLIYSATPELSAEQADAVVGEIFKRIPATPPLIEILRDGEEAELNLNEDLLSNLPGDSPEKPVAEELKHSQLCQRFNVKPNTLRGARNRSDFPSWSQQHDPYGLSWEYNSQEKIYRGLKVSPV